VKVFILSIVAALLLAAAAYAQLRIPYFTSTRAGIVITRTVLAAVGVAFGYVSAGVYPDDRVRAVLAFLIGFGAVHFPAAFILLVKAKRGSGKS
jgi:hypothetical protein